MPSRLQVRNHQQESTFRARQSKIRETSMDTADTFDTVNSISPVASQDPKDRMVAQMLVSSLTDDIIRTASDYSGTPDENSSRLSRVQRNRSSESLGDPVVDDQVADESKSHWVEQETDQVDFSVEEIKRMVLDSLPHEVKNMVTLETWDRIFNEASEDEIMTLRRTSSEEDITDLVSFVSVYVQREGARGRPRGDSDVSEMTFPHVEPTRRSSTTSRMDAVALTFTPVPVTENDGYENEKPIDAPQERIVSRYASVDLATGLPIRPLSMELPIPPTPKTAASSLPSAPTEVLAKPVVPQISEPAQVSGERRIAFHCVEIRYYEQILSDNPAVTSGPPVGLGWKYRIMKKDMSVDAWEHRQRPHRRYLTELIITRHERTHLLQDLGYSQKEIALGVRSVLMVKNKRKQTYNNLRFQNMEEMIESTSRRFKNVLTLGMAKRKEKKMLEQFKLSPYP